MHLEVFDIVLTNYPGDLPAIMMAEKDYIIYLIKVHKDSDDIKFPPDGTVCAFVLAMQLAIICSKETKHKLTINQAINYY